MPRTAISILFVLSILSLSPALLEAQMPAARLSIIFPAGASQGGAVDVAVAGPDLDEVERLVFTHPGITAAAKRGPLPPFEEAAPLLPGQFRVSVAADVPEGIYEVRAVGKYGITNPRLFQVDHLGEVAEVEANNLPAQAMALSVGTLVNGKVNGGTDRDCFRVSLKKDQRIQADCWAQRLDSRLDGTLVILDASGSEVARSRSVFREDPFIDFVAPADGDYVVQLFDQSYRGGEDYFYRLKLAADPFLYLVRPAAGMPGTVGRYTLYGVNLPGSQPAPELSIDGRPLERLEVDIQLPLEPVAQGLIAGGFVAASEAGLDGMEYRLETPRGASNPIFIGFSPEPVVVEREPNDAAGAAQKVNAPCEVSGSFFPAGDQDWVQFEARRGETLWIEVAAQRLGLPSDPYLVLHQVEVNDKGEESMKELARADDLGGNIGGAAFNTETEDAAHRFVAPADGSFRVLVFDQFAALRSDPLNVYRLSIRRERPDYRLIAVPRYVGAEPKKEEAELWSPVLRRGGVEAIDVFAFRRDGFNGAIDLRVDGLPDGVRAAAAGIREGQSRTTVLLEAAADAKTWFGRIDVVGSARIGAWPVERRARAGALAWGARDNLGPRPRLMRELDLAVQGDVAVPIDLAIEAGSAVEVSRGAAQELVFKLARRFPTHGKFAVSGFNVPPGVEVKDVTVDEKAEELKVVVQVKKEAPTGEHFLCLASAPEFDFARNPEAAQRAEARKQRMEQIVAGFEKSAQEGTAARDAAAKAAAEAEERMKKSAADLTAAGAVEESARKALEEAKKLSDAAANAFSEAQKAAEAAAKAAAEAQKRAAELAEKAQSAAAEAESASKARAEVEKLAAEMQSGAQKAGEARTAAEKSLEGIGSQLKEAQGARERATKEAQAAAEAAKPKKIKAGFLTRGLTLQIVDVPVRLRAEPATVALKTGEKAELALAIERLNGFNGPVALKLALPGGVSGIQAAEVQIPEGQNEAKLVVEAGADATAGTHGAAIEARMKFNNVDLETRWAVAIQVEKAPAK
jgi:hypothetical protein